MNQNPKMSPVGALLYYAFVLALIFLTLYAFGMLRLAISVVILALVLGGIYKIGNHFGWWKEGFK